MATVYYVLLLAVVVVYPGTPAAAGGVSWNDVQQFILKVQPAEEDGLTCWTCPNKTDNEACNDWAPDKICHRDHTVCKTVHLVETDTGSSVSVSKSCASADECHSLHVGCHDTFIPGVKECISCCTEDYCNEAVPINLDSALQLSSFTAGGAVCAASVMMYAVLALVWLL